MYAEKCPCLILESVGGSCTIIPQIFLQGHDWYLQRCQTTVNVDKYRHRLGVRFSAVPKTFWVLKIIFCACKLAAISMRFGVRHLLRFAFISLNSPPSCIRFLPCWKTLRHRATNHPCAAGLHTQYEDATCARQKFPRKVQQNCT